MLHSDSEWETTIVESICEKYWRKLDDNWMINKNNIHAESVICAAVMYALPSTDFEIVKDIMTKLHPDSSIRESRIVMTTRLVDDYKNKVGNLKDARLVPHSKAVELRKMLEL